MTKIIRAKYKASRHLNVSIWGDNKDPFHKRNYRPGQHGTKVAGKASDYALHLKAKQRLKMHYGRINERQFRNMFTEAVRMKGNTGENFVGILESRLDAFVYRMTLSPSIFGARQLVSHGHITVNGKRVNIASYKLRANDVVSLKEASKQLPIISESLARKERSIPDYIAFDEHNVSAKFLRIPTTSDIPYPFVPELHLIVEFYSK